MSTYNIHFVEKNRKLSISFGLKKSALSRRLKLKISEDVLWNHQ